MRVTYRRELLAKEEMKKAGFRVFIPMVMTEVRDAVTKKPRRVEVPAIHSLLFAYARPSLLQKFKNEREYIQYISTKAHTEARHKIVVPDEQMEAFIRLYEEGHSEFILSENFKPGTRVKVTNGPFEGMTGTFQRINGHRNRYFVISLDGLISIGTALIRPDMIEKIM